MNMEAAVTERLQKLRQWQAEQQEKLFKEQQMQREILSHEQDRIYKALGISVHDLQDIMENTDNELIIHSMINEGEIMSKSLDGALSETKKRIVKNINASCEDHNNEEEEEETEVSNCMSEAVNSSRNSTKDLSFSILQKKQLDANMLIEGVAPLSLTNVASNKHVSLDDMPVPSSKKDFQTLLEEKLNGESAVLPSSDSQTKTKKPFLRKGQGLSRFKISAHPTTARRRSASLSVNTQHVDRTDRSTKATVEKDALSEQKLNRKQQSSSVLSSRGKVSHKSVTPVKRATTTPNGARHLAETSVSDFDSKVQRELEEQSTPFKVRERLNRSESEVGVAVSTKQRHERLSAARRCERFESPQRSYTAGVIHSYWDTITIDDSAEEEAPKRPPMIDEISRSDEDRHTPCDERAGTCLSLTDSDEERDVTMEDPRDDHPDSASHRVRFSEHNEYRTIDLGNASNASSRSSVGCYLERENGKERSTTSSESSDVSDREVNGNERAVNASIQLSLQQSITENSYYRIMKALSVSEEDNSAGCEDESPGGDNEKVVEAYDEEQPSVLSSSSSSLSSLSDVHRESTQRKEYALKSEPATEKADKTFEPELLKSRLLELEKEIDIFRKESSALLLQRRKLQEDQTTLRKEYAEKERSFEESKRRVQIQLEEEKKRLAREKAAMESRIRDAQEKARQNKAERRKAQSLEDELERLRDELNIKESRWSAAESRHKSELRALRTEISKLKQEIASMQAAKRTNLKNARKTGQAVPAKTADRRVNKPVVATSARENAPAKTPRRSSAVSPDVSVHEEDDEEEKNEDEPAARASDGSRAGDHAAPKKRESKREREVASKCSEKSANEARRKRDLYKNLLNDAMSDLLANPSSPYVATQDASAQHGDESCPSSANENLEGATANITERCNRSCRVDDDEEDAAGAQDRDVSLRRRAGSAPNTSKDIVRQIEHSDGRIEYWYPNGNVKKVFPEQGMTKMIYYNGDVRETERDGRVKYFYATTRTWHTTTPDGLEILEFPDGQVERRTSDGTVQVSFPDGATRIAQANGTEKWMLPDGTVAQTFVNGDKVLTFPNGQREVHTKEHKRREYPDGTVKLVYADGTQETRYSSGRKRLRDKDGNLLMDSYDT
ncbi:PREDICTED: centromere protein J isoform X2 [Dinoponera quadriceps]|uniref:Centromere protein J isoform X2 n=1 Tax=Dinoponera quadriceps TaxID=609295 RepID=A0A6P3Y7M7_DINQU|nr:PREDICTED: centromere protein J isoform X2 [Dinoponera quadriceps]